MKRLKGLKKIDTTQLKSFRSTAAVDEFQGLDDGERVFHHRYQKRLTKHLERVSEAARVLKRLPEKGEVFTILMSGSFDGWDFVSAVLQLGAPATIDQLFVATLGFSNQNAGELLTYLDQGTIARCWFLASCYMRDASGAIFNPLVVAMKKRGQHIKAARNHAKVICAKLTDGRHIVVDGSMNLRSCKNIEQAHLWNDAYLFKFFATYIRETVESKAEVK